MIKRWLLLPLFLSVFVLAGCESGETVHQDTTVRTRSDGTKIKSEEKIVRQSDGTVVKTETKKVDRPDDDDDDDEVRIKVD
jgi:hypothetical protein